MMRQVYALLGRKDEPTDAVEEYCRYLGAALLPHEIQLNIRRVPWKTHGWHEALRGLKLQSANWRDTWVFLQYTALAWSSHGFPFHFLRVLRILKSVGARVGIVFHDVTPYSSPRLIDQLRHHSQQYTMRRALLLSDLAIFTVPLYKLSWLPFNPTNALYTDPIGPAKHKLSPRTLNLVQDVISREAMRPLGAGTEAADPSQLQTRCHFIPVGPNLSIPELSELPRPASNIPTVGVFSITGGEQGTRETKAILAAVRYAAEKIGKLRLLVFGRHAELREATLRDGLQGIPVELSVDGVLDDRQVVDRLCACDVLLFLRGGISTRRSSAIAGISCGVPMIAYSGAETSWPFHDAGVIPVSSSNPEELSQSLLRLLSDHELRESLSRANQFVYQEHFAWSVIASRFAALLVRG